MYGLVTHVFEWLKATTDIYTIPTVRSAELMVAYDRMAATETEASRLTYCESLGSHTRVGTPTDPK